MLYFAHLIKQAVIAAFSPAFADNMNGCEEIPRKMVTAVRAIDRILAGFI
jgi:hypothetical protein